MCVSHNLRTSPERTGSREMTQKRADRCGDVEYYAEDATVGALTLLNHPILHAVRVRNHMRAEGIDDGER